MSVSELKFDTLRHGIIALKNNLPPVLAKNAVNQFVGNFDKQGWEGKSWQQVKRRIPGTTEYKYPKTTDLGRRTRPILIGKGSTQLRRAVANSVRVQSWPIVRCVVDLPYASAHNDGVPERNLPKRQYMGNSPSLDKKQRDTINSFMKKLF